MSVPTPIPGVVRAGTGDRCQADCCNRISRASFGVQGAFVAPLLNPLPFRHPRQTARNISPGRDARYASLYRKGKGYAPAPRLASLAQLAYSDQRSSTAIQGGAVDDSWRLYRDDLCLFLPFTMLGWIHQFFKSPKESPPDPAFHLVQQGRIESDRAVKTFRHDRFRIRLFRDKDGTCDCCGRRLFWVSLDFRQGAWESILTLDERKLPHVMESLNELQQYLEKETEKALKKKMRLP